MVSPRCLTSALEDAKTAAFSADKTHVGPEISTEEQKQMYQRKHDLVQTEEDTTKGSGDEDETDKQKRNADWWSWYGGWWKRQDWQSWGQEWESWDGDRNRPWMSRDWSWDSKADTESLKERQLALRAATLDQIKDGDTLTQPDSQVPQPDKIDENKGVRFVEKDTNKEVLAGFCYETKLFWLKRLDANHEVQMSPSPDELGIPENVQKSFARDEKNIEQSEMGGENGAGEGPKNSNENVKEGQTGAKDVEEKKEKTGGGEKGVNDGQVSTKEDEEKKEPGGEEKEANQKNSNEGAKDGQVSTKEDEEKKKEPGGGEKEADPKNSNEGVKDGQVSTKEDEEKKKEPGGGEKEADPKNSNEGVKDGQVSTKAEEKTPKNTQEAKDGEGTGGGKNTNKADPKNVNEEAKKGPTTKEAEKGKELAKVEDAQKPEEVPEAGEPAKKKEKKSDEEKKRAHARYMQFYRSLSSWGLILNRCETTYSKRQ